MVQAYLDSPAWQEYIRPEKLLHQAANRSLDRTIDALGRDQFEIQLQRFLAAKHRVQEVCAKVVRMPCTPEGERIPNNETDCLQGDMGCGFACLDQVAAEMSLDIVVSGTQS